MARFVKQWLDLPISATHSGISLPRNKFGLNLLLPSVKFQQCQTVLRNISKSSFHDVIKSLWRSTSFLYSNAEVNQTLGTSMCHGSVVKISFVFPDIFIFAYKVIQFIAVEAITTKYEFWFINVSESRYKSRL